MAAVVIALVQILLAVYALVDCLRTDKSDLPGRLPRAFWLLIIIVLPLFGPLAWIVISWARNADSPDGRVEIPRNPLEIFRGSGERSRSQEPEIPEAPDDNPDFLFSLEAKMRREKLAREAEEEALRRAAKNQQHSDSGQDAAGSGKDSSAQDSDEDEANPDANPPEKPSAED
ncbi:PLD nuclease N-terminal domain-containing protein [uncultured Varibaculum sp.]|uniref:PLD nuclease N-terminal domain-containing protein n=1 Tax=uncultured Varibaculum sp. TaxID=413896 RepID=UPI00288A5E37|nr:PLD nuclease N-terminal domain-containing protein [uncultured Varibaculum sp.]